MKKPLLPEQDAYGRNIYESFLSKKPGYDIVEREDGYFSLNGDSDAYTIPFEEWDAIQKQITALIWGRVLDIGCGAGKHSLHLQNMGLDVCGIDNSPLAIEVCKLRGLRKAFVADLSDLNKTWGIFDTVLMLGNNFGLLENAQKAKKIFKKLYQITSEKACIFAETMNPYGRAFNNEEDKAYQQSNLERGRLPGQLRVRIRYKKYVTPWSDYLFVSKTEMQDILTDTGWQISAYMDEPKWDQYIAKIEKSS